jgi:hypothetical protein
MRQVLFAGPSIYGLDLGGAEDLVLRPPAACGDILAAVREGFRAIGLVDGVFGSERSVWHKEILVALDRGVRVLGAASMGALRAAECDRFGMEGVGAIYVDYRDGRRTDDSDVALLHGPAELNFRPLTLALADADATLANLRSLGLLSPQQAESLKQTARQMHFSQRTWRAMADTADSPAQLLDAVSRYAVEQKKADACELIALVREGARTSCGFRRGGWVLNRTDFLAALEGRLP